MTCPLFPQKAEYDFVDPVTHLKQTKLQKDAGYQVNRSHNRRCSDHR
jgi:hypothetical protein